MARRHDRGRGSDAREGAGERSARGALTEVNNGLSTRVSAIQQRSVPTPRGGSLSSPIVARPTGVPRGRTGPAAPVGLRYQMEDEMPTMTQADQATSRSEEHTSELQSLRHLVCRLL